MKVAIKIRRELVNIRLFYGKPQTIKFTVIGVDEKKYRIMIEFLENLDEGLLQVGLHQAITGANIDPKEIFIEAITPYKPELLN